MPGQLRRSRFLIQVSFAWVYSIMVGFIKGMLKARGHAAWWSVGGSIFSQRPRVRQPLQEAADGREKVPPEHPLAVGRRARRGFGPMLVLSGLRVVEGFTDVVAA